MLYFLIGFMGAGKTTLGKRLARQAALPFIDLDVYIETNSGKSISALFAAIGETAFRALEREALERLTATHEAQSAIISCGGGTPCFNDNMAWMNDHGTTIYLQQSATLLIHRLRPKQHKRPLIAPLSPFELPHFVREKLAQREVFYLQAHHIVPLPDVEKILPLIQQSP